MSQKSKGIAAERQLVHILQSHGYAAIRIAGSGSTKAPSADILAGNGSRLFSIECKSLGDDQSHCYIERLAVHDFISFSRQFGAEPWFAIRFSRAGWRFLLCEDIPMTEKNACISKELAISRGLSCDEIFGSLKKLTEIPISNEESFDEEQI